MDSPALPLHDALPQQVLQVPDVVVPENLDGRAAELDAVHNGLVVHLIAQHEASLGAQRGDGEGVGGEPHTVHESLLHAQEARHDLLHFHVALRPSGVRPRGAGAGPAPPELFHHLGRAVRVVRGKAQVIVRPKVQAPPGPAGGCGVLSARVPLPPPLRHVDPRPGGGGDRPVEDVHDPHVQPPRVEVLGVANDGGHPPFPCGAGGVKAEEPVQKVPHAADLHEEDPAQVDQRLAHWVEHLGELLLVGPSGGDLGGGLARCRRQPRPWAPRITWVVKKR
mmetsp:Transcript_10335/g.31590  ORF Transcript_10335/g.31590 Transcript_10335/m.31590 type:complete len:279 (+) Transcript_10335:1241-2077(+)